MLPNTAQNSSHNIFLYVLHGITWQDNITKTEVRGRTDQPAISEIIRHRRLAMLGHVSRMPPSADAYRAVYQPSDWHIRPDRARQTWLTTIRRDLQLLDIDHVDVADFAADACIMDGTDWRRHAPLWCMLLSLIHI